MYVKVKTLLSDGTDKEKFPSTLVEVPTAPPFTRTETPGRGRPSSAPTTLPVIVLFWAIAFVIAKKPNNKKASNFLFI